MEIETSEKIVFSWGLADLVVSKLHEYLIWIMAHTLAITVLLIISYTAYNFVLKFIERRKIHQKTMNDLKYANNIQGEIFKAFEEIFEQRSGNEQSDARKQIELILTILEACGKKIEIRDCIFRDTVQIPKSGTRGVHDIIESVEETLKEKLSNGQITINDKQV